MSAPIIHINGYPGTGKLTIAKALRDSDGVRILDNHSIYNVAFALLDFGTNEFKRTVEAVEKVALSAITHVPEHIAVVVTNALFSDSEWGLQRWEAVAKIGLLCCRPVGAVILKCDLVANLERVQAGDRAAHGKLTDGEELIELRNRPLIESGTDALLHLDVSDMTPADAACAIHAWMRENWPEYATQQDARADALTRATQL